MMPVRKVVRRTGWGFRSYFPSRKVGRMIECESLLEADACLLFECSPAVVSYEEQPACVSYHDRGEPRTYYPDFELVLRNEQRIHVEVKPSAKLHKRLQRNRLDCIAQHYVLHRPEHFLILTEAEIRPRALLSNLRKLHYHNRRQLDVASLERLREAFQQSACHSFEQLIALLGSDAAVWNAAAKHRLWFDMTEALSLNTRLETYQEAHHDALYV